MRRIAAVFQIAWLGSQPGRQAIGGSPGYVSTVEARLRLGHSHPAAPRQSAVGALPPADSWSVVGALWIAGMDPSRPAW
jgi:hypothetical protein